MSPVTMMLLTDLVKSGIDPHELGNCVFIPPYINNTGLLGRVGGRGSYHRPHLCSSHWLVHAHRMGGLQKKTAEKVSVSVSKYKIIII